VIEADFTDLFDTLLDPFLRPHILVEVEDVWLVEGRPIWEEMSKQSGEELGPRSAK
jgi:hypothetical protein